MKKCYSTNEEDFNHDTIEEAAERIFDDETLNIWDVCTVFEGEAIEYSASSFIPDVCEYMQERAYDEVGEYSEDWLFTKEQEAELQDQIGDLVNKWANKHNLQPRFYSVQNVKPINIRLKDDMGGFENLTTK